jgi:hypothetical protein
MISWLINLIKHWLGHQLLADEEEHDRKRDEEIARKRKDIIDAEYSTDQTADDLDNGTF